MLQSTKEVKTHLKALKQHGWRFVFGGYLGPEAWGNVEHPTHGKYECSVDIPPHSGSLAPLLTLMADTAERFERGEEVQLTQHRWQPGVHKLVS